MSVPPKKFNPHPFAYHQEVELVIERLDAEGVGWGAVGGQVVGVPFVDVGETVLVRIWRNEAGFSRGDLVGVVQSSANRVAPTCGLFSVCNGCQCQHLSYAYQLSLKQIRLKEIYQVAGVLVVPGEAGMLPSNLLLPTIASPKTYGYRTKITPHYKPLKDPAKKDEFPVGFLKAVGMGLLDVPTCPIATPHVNEAYAKSRAEVFAKRETFKKDGTLHLREDFQGNVLTDPRAICTEEFLGVRYQFVAGEFFQINRSILPLLLERVLAELRGDHVIDAYCGVGFFALQAARLGKKAVGVEVNKVAIDLAKKNAELNALAVEFLAASAEAIFAQVQFPADDTTVIIDPPRAGCSVEFLRQLIALNPTRVVYVACDASTQARDVKILMEAGYKLTSLQAFDLFPQTKHIEALAVLER